MSLRSPIPKEIREVLNDDPVMLFCIFDNSTCKGRTEWHHWSYAGKRVNELWSIVPLCEKHHRLESAYRTQINAFVRRRIIHFKAKKQFLKDYPRSDLFAHHIT